MNFAPGSKVTFADANATVSDGVLGLREGLVNGPPLTDESGKVTHVPVFVARDHGRESTTVWVAIENVMGSDG